MHKAVQIQTKENFKIVVTFNDGKVVLYDMEPLFALIPGFRLLQTDKELYHSAQIDEKGEEIFWNEHLRLDAKRVWAQGALIEFKKKPDVSHLLAYRMQLSRFFEGMTQKELAEKTGIHQADISKFERGQGNPSLNTLDRLAKGLNMDLYVDFRYPVKEKVRTNSEGGNKMGRLADRRGSVFIVKPEMTEAFIQHMIDNKKPDNYWEECAKSNNLPPEVVEEIIRIAREEDD